MAKYPTVAYSELKERVKALAGLENLQTVDEKFIRNHANKRLKLAYERYAWPQFTVVGDKIELDALMELVTYVGTNPPIEVGTDVLVLQSFDDSGVSVSPGEYLAVQSLAVPNGNPVLIKANGQTITTTFGDTGENVWWKTVPGRLLSQNAHTVFRVHKEDPLTTFYAEEYTFLITHNEAGYPSIKIIAEFNLTGTDVYVTYRKHLEDVINADGATTGLIGDQAGDSAEIPWLFFEAIVHGTYAEGLREQGQLSKALAEEQTCEGYLQQEIEKIKSQGRQFRHDIIQFRPASQFRRHNTQAGGTPVGVVTAQTGSDVQ